VSDVLYTDVDPLLDIAVAHDLVHDYTNSTGSNIVDDARPSVVESMGHALLLSSVCFDVYNITNAEGNEVRGELDCTMLCGSIRKRKKRATWSRDVPLNPRLNIWRVLAR
jgi:hypothetical protein